MKLTIRGWRSIMPAKPTMAASIKSAATSPKAVSISIIGSRFPSLLRRSHLVAHGPPDASKSRPGITARSIPSAYFASHSTFSVDRTRANREINQSCRRYLSPRTFPHDPIAQYGAPRCWRGSSARASLWFTWSTTTSRGRWWRVKARSRKRSSLISARHYAISTGWTASSSWNWATRSRGSPRR